MKKVLRWFGLVLLALLAGGVVGTPCAEGRLTQTELDRIVGSEVLMLEHHEDSASLLNHLMTARGVSRHQLAESFARIARRYMNAPMSSDEGFACNGALYSLGEFASDQQLTNLVYIALNSTNGNARIALLSYHGRQGGSLSFADLAEKFLQRGELSMHEKSLVWALLMADINADLSSDSKIRERIIRIAKSYIVEVGENAPYADDILVRHEPGYALSAQRRHLVIAIMGAHHLFPPSGYVRKKYAAVLKKIMESRP